MSERYRRSEELLARAEQTIPLGTQTFSKSKTQFPYGVSPFYATRAQGSQLWDADGNEYIDFISSLAAVTLGYNDPDVTAAVRAQLDNGVIFSLPTELELQVSELLVELVPSAERVRFGKNGSDATAGAIRVARAFTGRDRVAVCGYHGWQDWYIGSTARNRGVPESTRSMTHRFEYNNLESLDRLFHEHPREFAAVIMEPMNIAEPAPGFLAGVAEATRRHGAVFIFDEVITGFRFANGGAQELFGVTPDLTTLGKGIANGYPLSAVVGRADIMALMEEVFFSFTMGGEALSLAAAGAALTKLKREPVVEKLRRTGQKILDGTRERITKHGIGGFARTSGHPSWTFLQFANTPTCSQWEIKTLFMQEVQARGILSFGTHNVTYAHTDEDVAKLLRVYDEVFPILCEAVEEGAMKQYLRCTPLQPLFRVR